MKCDECGDNMIWIDVGEFYECKCCGVIKSETEIECNKLLRRVWEHDDRRI